MTTERASFQRAEHWLIKLGSAVFLNERDRLDRPTFASLVADIADLLDRGHRVTLVSSGAVALGREYLNWASPQRRDIPYQQALAALGQSRLMKMYSNEFSHYGYRVAQILFTRGDLDARKRFFNARVAIDELDNQGAVPIINENDTVATDELRFGDNDQLAGMTCAVVDADIQVLLTHVDGVFDVVRDEEGNRQFGERISKIEARDDYLDEIAGPTESVVGKGGMASKVKAARIAGRIGIPTVVANGKEPQILAAIREGEDVGTVLESERAGGLTGKKLWLGAGAKPTGTVFCDAGAKEAIQEQGGSLLPTGVVGVNGEFEQGAVVNLTSEDDEEPFARGVAGYGADEIRQVMGHQSSEIDTILGYRILDSVLHRDSLVVF